MLQTGIKGKIELTVTTDKCAGAVGSGELNSQNEGRTCDRCVPSFAAEPAIDQD